MPSVSCIFSSRASWVAGIKNTARLFGIPFLLWGLFMFALVIATQDIKFLYYSSFVTQSSDIHWPWELHEDGETEDVLKWSQECPKDNASNHFLQVMLREARPYIMMRACCLRLELLKLVTIFLKAVTPFGRESCMKMVRQKMSSNDPRNAPKSCCMPIFERVILC